MTPADLPSGPASSSLLALLGPAALVAGAAATYAGSMVLMKFWDAHGGPLLALAIAGAVVLAVILEIAALREMKLGLVYVAVLGVEAVLVMLAAHGLFGETFTPRELAGAGIIVAGVAVMSL
jgi:multidrug transporter EmrE-like cation transporter